MRSAARSKGRTSRLLTVLALVGSVAVAAPLTASAGTSEPTVTLFGGGWGHGVGMSQYGALGQALEDPNATGADIAAYYYTGSSVEALTDVLASDHFLLAYDQPLWVGLLADRTSFRFIPRDGNLDLCHAGPGEDCSQALTAADGELWIFEVTSGGCRFRRDGGAKGTPGSCMASIALGQGMRVELPDWSNRSVADGTLQVRPHDGGFHVSLATEIDEYVAGIAEMPTGWESAALQAQAIAARSFALAKAQQRETGPRDGALADPALKTTWQSKCWCHVRASSRDQVYKGWSRTQKESWAAATADTAGLVLTHPDSRFTQNGIIEAFYSSSTSGVTESNMTGFGSTVQYPYLLPVDDHWSSDPDLNPNASWAVTVTAHEIIDELGGGLTELLDVELLSSPPESLVRFTGLAGGHVVSMDVTGRWLRRFGLKSGQITGVSSTLTGLDPGVLSVAGYRVDDGPSHDGTGNDSKGNNDGIAQCGETIELYVTISNDGDTALTGISAALSESDPYLKLLYNTSSAYPNLAVGNEAENPRDWDLRVSSDTPNGHKFTFTLTYTTDQTGPAQHTVTIPITCGAPEPEPGVLSVAGYRVDDGPSHDGTGNDSKGNNDGIAQCGETIELYVTISNDGDTALTGISAALSESDPYLKLLYNTSASYPDLNAGATAENPRDWDLRVSPDTPNGHKFTFTLTYTTDQTGPAQHTVTIPITCGAPEPEPGVLSVAGYRVDDGPSHDGTGNDSKGNNDGIAQCGETIELYVTISNDGDTALTGISAALSESDPYLKLLYNTSASYPDLNAGATAENPRDWDLRVSPDTPNGHKFTFTLTYTTDQTGPPNTPSPSPSPAAGGRRG